MSALTPEMGTPGNLGATWRPTTTGGKIAYTPEPAEHTFDLRYPLNVPIFQEMARSDSAIGSLLRAMTNPIISANWSLDTEGVRPEVEEFVKTQIGLADPGKAQRRKRRSGVVWTDHVREALTCLTFGHSFFEQVYRYDPTDQMIHLRKLALRPANTITDIQVARDGGLEGVWQTSPTPQTPYGVMIPVEKLVAYVLEREGADWTGSSVLRSAYKHWLVRDQLIRIDAQSIERNRMGIPVIEYDPADPVAKEEAERIVADVRAGESAGVVVPAGSNFKLVGVTGSTADALPSMNWHDQAISRSALAMFMNLGHDAGARSLADTFHHLFKDALQAVADEVATTATEHVIRDLVELNYGPDEPYPVVTPGRLASTEATAESLAVLANAGLLTPDAATEQHLRDEMGMPAHEPSTARAPQGNAGMRVSALTERLTRLAEAQR